MTINILTEVMRTIHKQNENFNKRNITSTEKESELKNTISELKNSVEGFSDRLDQTGQYQQTQRQVSVNYPIRGAKRKKRMKKTKDSLKDLQDTSKWTNEHIMRVPEGKERLSNEIMAKNVQNLGKEKDIQVK